MYNCRAEEGFNVLIYKMCNNASCASPTPKGVIYGHFPHRVAHPKKNYEHLWLIDGHF